MQLAKWLLQSHQFYQHHDQTQDQTWSTPLLWQVLTHMHSRCLHIRPQHHWVWQTSNQCVLSLWKLHWKTWLLLILWPCELLSLTKPCDWSLSFWYQIPYDTSQTGNIWELYLHLVDLKCCSDILQFFCYCICPNLLPFFVSWVSASSIVLESSTQSYWFLIWYFAYLFLTGATILALFLTTCLTPSASNLQATTWLLTTLCIINNRSSARKYWSTTLGIGNNYSIKGWNVYTPCVLSCKDHTK